MVLWEGRFKKELDSRTNDFNSSISIDSRMYKQDILGSIAHSTMLEKQGIISLEDKEKIVNELTNILNEIENGTLKIDPHAEDIHMFIETELTKRIGDSGKKLHTARSRNDQVALDLRMYIKDEINSLIDYLKILIKALCNKAEENLETVMPGYTHLQRAQPITFAHHLMAYVEMLLRDIQRLEDCYKRVNIMPLGSCALAGTTYNTDRNYVKELLEFDEITQNSLDGVSDRDFAIEFLSCMSIIMMHLSRFSEEVVMWCSWEFKFIELDDAFSTGSSIMPQKKNPDITELVRGKTGRVYGDLITMLTVMKGLPLAYNKDMQEDKEAIFDSIDTVKICITTLIPMIETMKVLKENMKKAAQKGFINATDCADYLVRKGMPFRDAYKVTGQIVALCNEQDKTLDTLELEEYKKICNLFEEDIYQAIDLINCVNSRKVPGGPAAEAVAKRIQSTLGNG
ncbi:MAG: argininosuccinate lyase [Clostridia bacterium]|nr:argininosuccinate lyase [Clostridia bacterium]